MEIARATSKMTGQTVTKAFEDISLAVGRQSKMILDNLGIIVRVDSANEEYAKTLGKTARQLTDVEKKQAFLNATVKAGEEMMQRLGKQTKTTAEWFQSLEAFVENSKVALGKGLIEAIKIVVISFTRMGQVFNMVLGGIFGTWEKFLGLIEKLPGPHRSKVAELKEDVAGIAQHFRDAVTQADNFVNSISNLQSGSARITAPNIGLGGGPNVGGAETGKPKDDILDSWREHYEIRYELLSRSLETEIELEAQMIETAQQMRRDSWEIQIQERAEAETRSLEMIAKRDADEYKLTQHRIKSIENLEKKSAKSRQSIFMNLGMAMLNFAGVNSEAIFAIQKGFEVGLAVMAAFTASNLALANPPGPPATAPLAAATLKAGLLNAAAIGAVAIGQFAASQNTGATGAGTYVSPLVTTPVNAPAITSPSEQIESKKTLQINIEGDFIGDEAYIDMLVEKINDAEDRDVIINQSRYSKSIS